MADEAIMNGTLDSLSLSYRCPMCFREGARISFIRWRYDDLKDGECRCGHRAPILCFRKSDREILALARGRVRGTLHAIGTGISEAFSILREMEEVLDPDGSAIAELEAKRTGPKWGTDTLDKLSLLEELIESRIVDLSKQ